jgi:UPF0755 protein
MSGSKFFSAFFLAVVLVVLGALLYVGYFTKAIFTPVSTNVQTIDFRIEPGEGVNQISQRLHDQGLISSMWDFEVYVWLRGWGSRLQAGNYSISQNITLHDLVNFLITGKDASPEKQITIIEGWTIADTANYLDKAGLVSAQEFSRAAQFYQPSSGSAPITALADKPERSSLEGYLFPDTYRIFQGSSSEDIIEKMLTNFESKLTPELRAEIQDKKLSIFDVVTMASIIEKEVRQPADLPLVSDIFWRRLRVGQRLESDATLNYVLAVKSPQLSAVDLKNTSPYNTYKHAGLPPGPICNPGLLAIAAAIHPQANNYWYFLNTPEGETKFATTYEEHLKNKRLYLK